ncbi:putative endochitinase-like [Capsicum annuum]|nr:putative endochitinase-like [Capsicum annuum]
MIVARGDKLSNLYVFHGFTSRESVNLVENDTSSELWHRKMSHMSEKGIDGLAKKKLLYEVKQAKLKKCVYCLAGKQKRVSFQSYPPSRKLDLLELVHSDLCGPFKVREQGIRHKKTPSETPQLNDLAERMNKILVERVRCMLSYAKLPDFFWAEALNTAAYVINLSLIMVLDGHVPDRVWYDQTIEDFDRVEKVDSQSSESLVNVDPVPLTTAPE